MSVLERALAKAAYWAPADLTSRRYDVQLTFRVAERQGDDAKPFHSSTFTFNEMNYHDMILMESFVVELLGNLVALGSALWEAGKDAAARKDSG